MPFGPLTKERFVVLSTFRKSGTRIQENPSVAEDVARCQAVQLANPTAELDTAARGRSVGTGSAV